MNFSHKIELRRLIIACTAGLTLISFSSCEEDAVQTLPERNWKMVWSDEFNDASVASPDAAKWSFDIGTGSGGWGNQELEYYTNRTKNVATDGKGNLAITAYKESYSGSAYTSGRIKTKGLFSQGYGKFEARIKTPYGQGIWPAFWLLGADIDTNPWPNCGEIDIMELRGQAPSIINGTIHGPGYSGGNAITKTFGLQDNRFDADYHIFSVEWGADKIEFFVDGYLYNRINKSDVLKKGNWVYDHPFYIIMNLAVGGNYVGLPNSSTVFPQTMSVDYVRVYEAAN